MLALTIDVLPANRGDCLLIECRGSGRPWRLLVDGGLSETWPLLRARLAALPDDDRIVDLAVVTHIDADHIGGMIQLLGSADSDVVIGDVWFNGLPQLPDTAGRSRSVAQGESLVKLLTGTSTAVPPWNRAFDGAAVCTLADATPRVVERDGWPTITVLTPAPRRLGRLRTKWEHEQGRLRRGEPSEQEEPPAPPASLDDLDKLATVKTAPDTSVANGSSIALLLEHRGTRCLLCGDAFVPDLRESLSALADERGGGPIEIDVFKLSHHGSRGNISRALLELVPARHYVVSTNGDLFMHPDDVALARVITAGPAGLTLWFNYSTAANRRWEATELTSRYGYRARYPEGDGQGVRIELEERP
jgi:Metallo-beta-lactamase superfamily